MNSNTLQKIKKAERLYGRKSKSQQNKKPPGLKPSGLIITALPF